MSLFAQALYRSYDRLTVKPGQSKGSVIVAHMVFQGYPLQTIAEVLLCSPDLRVELLEQYIKLRKEFDALKQREQENYGFSELHSENATVANAAWKAFLQNAESYRQALRNHAVIANAQITATFKQYISSAILEASGLDPSADINIEDIDWSQLLRFCTLQIHV
jgi:hypothetical protein